jgi:hypothetical protein
MTSLSLTGTGGVLALHCELGNTQGKTLEEVRDNLAEATQLILEANREEFEWHFSTKAKVTRECFVLRAA